MSEPQYVYPMGWRNAILGGLAYGAIVGGLVWIVWRAVTLAPVGRLGDVIAAFLFVDCFLTPLWIEWSDLTQIRKGKAHDPRTVRRGR
jgi:uncharacterized membrane protein